MNFISYADLSEDIRKNLYRLHDQDIDLVVGIPRSGMIPAYMIALHLNLNCIDLASFCKNERLVSGRTRKIRKPLQHAWDARRVLLVDDSIMSGKSMKLAIESLPDAFSGQLLSMAVYSSSKHPELLDIYFRHVAWPRVFEWNIYHHNILARSCVDIDGVLCKDPTEGQNDDGEKYQDFLRNAQPLNLPSGKIHSLITCRLEKYRKETETWLKRYDIEYENLIMLDLPSKEVRQRLMPHARYKAAYYNRSRLDFFIESEPGQALDIAKASGKPVFCVKDNKLYRPGLLESLYTNPSILTSYAMTRRLKQSIPIPCRQGINTFRRMLTKNN